MIVQQWIIHKMRLYRFKLYIYIYTAILILMQFLQMVGIKDDSTTTVMKYHSCGKPTHMFLLEGGKEKMKGKKAHNQKLR